ncbi:pyridoxamine 5'-phosphate oxidase family protein [Flavihumibacter sp. R14]|nr:pyridoxamine 5'-phosphate oxidase family protein [Flavihumibacter soli]
MENDKQESLKKLKSLVDEVKIAMLCTSQDSHLRSRPMSTAQFDAEGNLWFFTSEYSEKADEVAGDHEICLAYSSPSKNTYISISGYARIVNDWSKMKELYNPAIKAWFPKGLDDPDLALLKVSPLQAEYWDSSSSKMITLFQIAKAIVTGEKYHEGQHGKIEL